MGIQLTERMKQLMSPQDQKALGVQPSDQSTPRPEREEQRIFANDCLRRGFAYVWHSTASATKATLGCPDFIVAANGKTFWIEFKVGSNKLSADQQSFKDKLLANGATYALVHTANEAIQFISRTGN
jgi:hypothetical protein